MIKWLVQDVGIHMINLKANFEVLNRLNYPHENFGIINNEKLITNLDNILTSPEDNYIIRGGVKILSILNNIKSLDEVNNNLSEDQLKYSDIYIQKLKQAVFYDDLKFDQAYYQTLNLPLLNQDSKIYNIKDNLDLSFNQPYFIKPTKDLKAFEAGIIEPGVSIEQFITQGKYQKSYLQEQVLLSSCKKIISEYRFFIVNQKVITGSLYRLGGQGNLSHVIPENIMNTAKKYAQLYQPHDIFTMDLAETPEGIKIIEYNCWNASGSYHCDLMRTFFSIQEYMEEKNKKLIKKLK